MKKIVIHENERGILFRDGRYVKLLGAGKYYVFGGREIVVRQTDGKSPFRCEGCPPETLLADPAAAKLLTVAEAGDCTPFLHYVNGRFEGMYSVPGKYLFWAVGDTHEFRTVDISEPEVSPDIPVSLFESLPADVYTKVEVEEYRRARLYFNKKFVRLLEPGTYFFWKRNGVRVDVSYIDTRLTQANITGQELMTQDKVALRVNFVCTYRVTDYEKIFTEIDDYGEQLHVAAQLAMREYTGRYRLDDILAAKDEMSACIREKLKEKEAELFIEIRDAAVKDIILPGEVRDIMNTVLIAEKKAQANVITRREEVASTRSLLNTAKLMEENPTLYRLKELEYVERICENVGSINVNGSGDLLSQLAGMLRPAGTAGNAG